MRREKILIAATKNICRRCRSLLRPVALAILFFATACTNSAALLHVQTAGDFAMSKAVLKRSALVVGAPRVSIYFSTGAMRAIAGSPERCTPVIVWGNGIGKGNSEQHYAALFRQWAREGFVVIASESRVSLSSQALTKSLSTFEQWAADVPSSELPISSRCLFAAGKSRGANQAAALARGDQRICGLIAIGGGLGGTQKPALFITGKRDFARRFVARAYEKSGISKLLAEYPDTGHFGLDRHEPIRNLTTSWILQQARICAHA